MKKINTYLRSTVSKVKEDNDLKETAATNGPQGTVSQKTQQSVQLLLRGINRLLENINMINPEFVEHIDWSTLLTTIVENLHVVSHFKHETFSLLQYAMDLSQKSPLNGLQSGKPVILHILRLTTLFRRQVPLNV